MEATRRPTDLLCSILCVQNYVEECLKFASFELVRLYSFKLRPLSTLSLNRVLRSVEDELSAYVAKQDRVSASCRLTLLEEAELLDLAASGDLGGGGSTSGNQSRWWSNVDNVALYNRRNLIKAALEGTGRPVTVAYPAGGGNAASSASYALTTGSSSSSAVGTGTSKLAMFDSVKDDTIVTVACGGDKGIASFTSRFHSLGYTRPDEQVGAQAISYLNKALDHGEL